MASKSKCQGIKTCTCFFKDQVVIKEYEEKKDTFPPIRKSSARS